MNAPGPEPIQSLFRKLDPFRKYDAICSTTTPDGMLLILRPLWITADLFIVDKWPVPERPLHRRLLKHYKDILESDQGQSFVIVLQDKPIFQIDLFALRRFDDRIPVTVIPRDSLLQFIFDPIVLAHKPLLTEIFRLFLGYYFSFDGAERIFIPLQEVLHSLYPMMTQLGFVAVKNTYDDMGPVRVFGCTRKVWETKKK